MTVNSRFDCSVTTQGGWRNLGSLPGASSFVLKLDELIRNSS